MRKDLLERVDATIAATLHGMVGKQYRDGVVTWLDIKRQPDGTVKAVMLFDPSAITRIITPQRQADIGCDSGGS